MRMASSAVAEDDFWGVLDNGAQCKFQWVHGIFGGKVTTNTKGTSGYARVLFKDGEHQPIPTARAYVSGSQVCLSPVQF